MERTVDEIAHRGCSALVKHDAAPLGGGTLAGHQLLHQGFSRKCLHVVNQLVRRAGKAKSMSKAIHVANVDRQPRSQTLVNKAIRRLSKQCY